LVVATELVPSKMTAGLLRADFTCQRMSKPRLRHGDDEEREQHERTDQDGADEQAEVPAADLCGPPERCTDLDPGRAGVVDAEDRVVVIASDRRV
jgi:hypothetical protein